MILVDKATNEKFWGVKSSADDWYLLICFTLLIGKHLVVTDLKVKQSYRLNSSEFLVLKTHDAGLIAVPEALNLQEN